MSNYRLSELIDLTILQKLADAHYRAAGMPIGIIDAIDGSILVGSGWQDICVKFHRANPVALQRCRESDDYIKERLAEGEPCRYRCKNGLWDIGMPILVAGGHLATMFLGQFFYEGEIPDREFFRQQARQFGFPVEGYLEALDRVPVFSREKVDYVLEYDKALARFIADLAEHEILTIMANETIRESERKFRSIFENAIEGMFQTTPDGRYLRVNPSLAKMYGYDSPEEMIGAITDVEGQQYVNPEDRTVLKSLYEKQGFVKEFETELYRKDGGALWISMTARAVKGAGGEIIYYEGSVEDITARKKAEDILKDSEARFRQFVEQAPFPLCFVNKEGVPTYINKRFLKVFGYTHEDIPTLNEWWHLAYPDEQYRRRVMETWGAAVKKASQEGTDIEPFEYDVTCKDGTVRHVEISGVIMEDSFLAAFVDVTDRTRAEEELKTTHQRLLDIIEFLPDATFVIDQEKKVVAWNLACEEITGVRKEEIMGKGGYAYSVAFYGERKPMLIDCVAMSPDDLQQRYTSVRKKGHALYAETFAPMPYDKKGAHLSCNASPLFDKTGKVVGAIESLRDITEMKRLETHLFQAQKMEAIGTLAGGIAHDFNNVLTVFTGYGTLLQMGLGPDNPLRMYADQMLSAAEKATHLTHGLLAFSRKQPITLKPVKLNSIIEGTEKLLQRLLTEDIELRTSLSPDGITIMGDATQIDQILFNLATNARDAMPKGGTLVIESRRVELDREYRDVHGYGEPGTYALISITDTGIGMDDTTREHIFDPFFTTKEVGKGTGLGLSTVYGIVRQHNGYINVYSEPNMGTSFQIYFPAVEGVDSAEERAPAPMRGGSETILVAEDSEAVRALISRILSEYGYKTIEAIDGADAVDKFRNAKGIDLLIFDSVMPKKNGREAYDEIHKIDPEVRVIFTSGYTRDVFAGKGIEDRGFNFIQKPVSPSDLLQRIREVLDDKGES